MKKICTVALVLILLCGMLAVSVSAAGSGSLSLTSATGNRGETVTVNVKLNRNPGLVTMSIRVSYDTSVVQLTNVSNPGLLVGAQLNPSYGSPYTISWVDGTTTTDNTNVGTIATFTFKILDDAAIGDSKVTLQFIDSYDANYGENSFSASSGIVTVKCQHNYGDWEESVNGHQQTCSVCGNVNTQAHIWNSGTVTKPATCKVEGEKSYSCTVCGASKTESIPKTNDHTFGNLTAVDSAFHKDICSVCQKEVTQAHTWNGGKVTKPATCKDEGEKTYTCDGCKYVKTEKLNKTTDHTYGAWQNVDEANHRHTCSVCQKEETAVHTWNKGVVTKKATCKEEGEKTYTCTACKATKVEKIPVTTTHSWGKWAKTDADTHKRVCTVCEKAETGNHSYKTSWSKDKTNHYHECSVCKDQKDAAKHTPGPAATETTAQTCTVCKYIIKAALGHTHDYAKEWTTDENGHWYTCSGCEEKGSYADHGFENACDQDCAVCGYTRETSHNYGDSWATDGENHWHLCVGCGDIQDQDGHTPGPEATADTAQSCTVCGYEIAPALGIEETEPVQDAAEDTEQDAPAGNSFPWWIVIVVLAVAGAVAVFVILKKKK